MILASLLAATLACSSAQPSSPALQEAAEAARSGDRKKALKLLSDLRKKEKDPDRREEMGLLYAELKDYGTSEAIFAELIRNNPTEPRLHMVQATVYARAGDRGTTLKELGEARKLHPDAVLRQRMAALHQDLKDYGPARALEDELVAESSGTLSYRLDRASLAAATGDREGGLALLSAATGLPAEPDEKRRMAGIYRDLGDLDRARALLEGLPADPALGVEKAALALKAGDRAGALSALASTRARGPGDEVLHKIAALYQEMKEYGQARAVLKRIIKTARDDAWARLELADLERLAGDLPAAKAAVDSAAGLALDLQQRQRMALIYEELHEYKKARALIDALIKEQPQDPQLRLDRAYFAADAGDKESALKFLDETLARSVDPDDRRRVDLLYERLGKKP